MSQIIKGDKPYSLLDNDLVRMFKSRALAIMSFVLAVLISVLVMDHFLSAGDTPNLGLFGKKVGYLRENHDQYNVLFVGTSSIYRAINPVVLKEVAAGNGCDVRAFNLGVSKLRLTELRHIRDQLSPEMIGNYDLIVLSPMAASGITPANWPSSRIQYFSDWEGYKSSLIDIWEYPMTKRIPKVVYYSSLLTGSFAYRQFGIGRLTSHLPSWSGSAASNETGDATFDGGAILDFSRDGFVALDDEPHDQFKQRRNGILNNPGHFEGLKTKQGPQGYYEGAMAERSWRRFERAKDHFADWDVPILMFLPPVVNRQAQDHALAEQASARNVDVLNYNQMDRYPAFFETAYWFDFYHTSKEGAALVTEQLGQDICSFIDAKRS